MTVPILWNPRKDRTDAPPALDSRIMAWIGICVIGGYLWLILSWVGVLLTQLGHNDFSVFWAAGRLAQAGKAAAAYDWMAISDVLKRASPEHVPPPDLGLFFYPPWFLIALAPLGAFSYATAALTWIASTLAVYLGAARAILRGGTTVIAALSAPTVLLNVVVGQNGSLSAGLLGGGLALLDRAPIGAGILIGVLSYKPHYGPLLPLFLAVTGRWRVFASATTTVAALVGVTMLLFGTDVVAAFARAIPIAAEDYLETGQLSPLHTIDTGWEGMASAYAAFRALGFGSPVAWCAHTAVAAFAATASLWVAASGARPELKAASIATAAMIVPPYTIYYDLAILTVPIAFLVRDGLSEELSRSEWVALSVTFMMPLLDVAYLLVQVPRHGHWIIGPLMCAILAVVIGRRVIADPGFNALPVQPGRVATPACPAKRVTR